MATRPTPPVRYFVATLILGTPGVAVLAVLTAAGLLPLGPALLACCAVLAGTALVVRPLLKGLAAARDYIDSLARDRQTIPAPPHSWPAADLIAAVQLLHRRITRVAAVSEEHLLALEQVLDALPDPVVTLDPACRLVTANQAAKAVFGSHIIGLDLGAALRDPGLREAALAVLAETAPGASRDVEFWVPVPVERVYKARVVALPTPAAGNATAVIAIQDLTTAKRVDSMRGDFVANVSHELRTPLSSLVGFIETLRGPAAGDKKARERFLRIMNEQAGRMSRLVDDLLSLSAIELAESTPPTERVDLMPLLERLTDTMQPLADEKGMKLLIEAADEIPQDAAVIGDADQLAQVFQNLIDNAIKYGPAKSTVRLGVAAEGRGHAPPGRAPTTYAVAVIDESDGIPPGHLPRLTERFYRVDNARSRELGGTGLGLAIVKHIVNRHRGRLEIHSEPGRGSRFTVRLPAAA